MSSTHSATHSFSCFTPIKAKWSGHGFAVLDTGSGEINLHGTDDDMRDRLKRAIEAFAEEMQREPVAQAAE